MPNGMTVPNIYIGMSADDVLRALGDPLKSKWSGEPGKRGLIVNWFYDNIVLTLERHARGGTTCYRVTKIGKG